MSTNVCGITRQLHAWTRRCKSRGTVQKSALRAAVAWCSMICTATCKMMLFPMSAIVHLVANWLLCACMRRFTCIVTHGGCATDGPNSRRICPRIVESERADRTNRAAPHGWAQPKPPSSEATALATHARACTRCSIASGASRA